MNLIQVTQQLTEELTILVAKTYNAKSQVVNTVTIVPF